MKIFNKIQKELKATSGEMARLVGLRDATAWRSFRDSVEKIAIRPFLRLLSVSPIPIEKVLDAMKKELKIP